MKLRFTCLLFLILILSQNQVSAQTIERSDEERITTSLAGLKDNISFALSYYWPTHENDGKWILHISVRHGFVDCNDPQKANGELVFQPNYRDYTNTIKKGNTLLIKSADIIYELKALKETTILDTIDYEIDNPVLQKICKGGIQKLRIETISGFVDHTFDKDEQAIVQKALSEELSLIHKNQSIKNQF